MHARRERVLILFASLFVVGNAMLPLLGISKVFGISSIVANTGIELEHMLLLPIGAPGFPIALLAANQIGELYGRRYRSLVVVMLVIWGGALGLAYATDQLPDYTNHTSNAFGAAVAFVACGLLACVVQMFAFAWITVRWLRHILAALLGVTAGWGVFFLAARGLKIATEPEITGITLAGVGYTWLVMFIATPFALLVSRWLAVYLRVELRQRVKVDYAAADSSPAFARRDSW